jgi:uncharacterized protein (DUF1800 family)
MGLTSAIAANRFGLGARPGELAAIGGSGPDWLRAQLDGPAPGAPTKDYRARRAFWRGFTTCAASFAPSACAALAAVVLRDLANRPATAGFCSRTC